MRTFAFRLALIASLAFIALVVPWRGLPSFDAVKTNYHATDGRQTFLDRHGEIFHIKRPAPKDRRQNWIDLSSIPDHLTQTLIQIEDKRFYAHSGVDYKAVASALKAWTESGRLRGASTLSMQLATLLENDGRTRSKTIVQKIRQMIQATLLELFWSKQEILETYLNLVTYRGDLVGIDAASKGLFQKAPHGLTSDESLILAVLLVSPNAGVEKVSARACRYTQKNNCEYLQFLSKKSITHRARLPKQESLAPHFTRLVKSPNPTIKTTLDSNLQKITREAITSHLQMLKHQNVSDASALIMNHQTGEVLAYVGSSGDLSSAAEVDGVRALRQAGSTLKPFLYAKALEQNLMTEDTLLDDSPFQVQMPNGLYSPENYDQTFKGVVAARVALASSLNIPAVRVIDLLGVDVFYQTLLDLGFPLKTRQTYGHSLSLGAADVSLQNLVSAYAVLARKGTSIPLKIELTPSPLPRTIFKPETTEAITRILSSKDNRALTFGLDNPLSTPYPSAVKTGTSKDMRDNWCIGYTGEYAVGVWVGNFNGSPMWNVSGVSGAAPIWRTLMDALHPESYRRVTKAEKKPDVKHQALKRKIAKIEYPVNGTLIAFDPDIPEENQAIVLEHTAHTVLIWELDKKELKNDFIPLSQLKPGTHNLVLKSQGGETLDTVSFEVRGKSSVVANSDLSNYPSD